MAGFEEETRLEGIATIIHVFFHVIIHVFEEETRLEGIATGLTPLILAFSA